MATDPELAALYDSISPDDDRAALTTRVAAAIASKARAADRVYDPEAHSRRLASLLLPDILRYDPELPVGFTFVAQNGRRLQEETEVVVTSILNGAAG